MCPIVQSCSTLCGPMDCSPPGSSAHGIFQVRILESLPFPPPGDLPNPGIKPTFLTLPADSLPLCHLGSPYLKIRFPAKLASQLRPNVCGYSPAIRSSSSLFFFFFLAKTHLLYSRRLLLLIPILIL